MRIHTTVELRRAPSHVLAAASSRSSKPRSASRCSFSPPGPRSPADWPPPCRDARLGRIKRSLKVHQEECVCSEECELSFRVLEHAIPFRHLELQWHPRQRVLA